MGREKGFDNDKITRIINLLIRHPNGLWLRQIAKLLKYSPTTISKYIDNPIKALIDDNSLGRQEKPILRVIRLKPVVFDRLKQGQDINQIMKLLKIIKENE